jgi:glutamate synthase (NADPH/NADH) small chain
MGKPTGFMEFERRAMPSRPPGVRISDWYEIYTRADEHTLKQQGARCMDCGVPFCQSDTGCPIDNLIPEWNDLVYHGRWREAYERLIKTNNFPEWTGRICPAPCESACVLGIIDPPVTIKSIECAIIDRAFAEGWVQPRPPVHRTGKRVAVIGSGPAGLAAADQLNKAGHEVTVFERDDRIGGLLMYGVPNMKLDKDNVTRRVELLQHEGVRFKPNTNVGVDITAAELRERFDAVLLACGALKARELDLPGRDLPGVHLAMQYLHGVTKSYLDSGFNDKRFIDARDKNVIVIGGGDTGADCIGTALRQGCRSILNITRREREPDFRDETHPWPGPAGTYYLDYSHAEGEAKFGRDPREYGVLPLEFVGEPDNGVTAMRIERLEWKKVDGKWVSTPTGRVEDLPADLVFLAIGFTGHDTPEIVKQFGVTEKRGVIEAVYGRYATNVEGVFAAGDMRRGASLIVWAIAEGRGAARSIDEYLMGESTLPAPDAQASNLLSSAG